MRRYWQRSAARHIRHQETRHRGARQPRLQFPYPHLQKHQSLRCPSSGVSMSAWRSGSRAVFGLCMATRQTSRHHQPSPSNRLPRVVKLASPELVFSEAATKRSRRCPSARRRGPPRPCGFNEAATKRSRRFGSSEEWKFHHSSRFNEAATKRSRRSRDDWSLNRVDYRFNEAATKRSRRFGGHLHQVAPHLPASMRPRPSGRGDYRQRRAGVPGRPSGFNEAATKRSRRCQIPEPRGRRNMRASMRPRPSGRGDHGGTRRPRKRRSWLQ